MIDDEDVHLCCIWNGIDDLIICRCASRVCISKDKHIHKLVMRFAVRYSYNIINAYVI